LCGGGIRDIQSTMTTVTDIAYQADGRTMIREFGVVNEPGDPVACVVWTTLAASWLNR
jgi:hypothetical protein